MSHSAKTNTLKSASATTGPCQLCGQLTVLVKSHVWPSFAYKRYVANQSEGGKFFDLSAQREHNRQYKRNWFCDLCDNRLIGRMMETPVARLCRSLDANPTAPLSYGGYLLKFAVSISWRTLRFHNEEYDRSAIEDKWPASRIWRQYLLGRRKDVGAHTQHIFVAFDPLRGMHKALGGGFFPASNLIVSQVGPLFMVGLLSRREIVRSDLNILQRSEIRPMGGRLTPVTEWRAGGNITSELLQTLLRQQEWAVNGILEIARNRRRA
jgi:hypothetical protein